MDESLKCNIGTLNARGMNNYIKRSKIFNWAKTQRIDILFLQETFWTAEILQKCCNDWDGECYINPTDSSHSRGVAILISKHLLHHLKSVFKSDDGRLILINIEHENTILTLVSIYAPNVLNDRISFFEKSQSWIQQHALNLDNLIVGGDFNCIYSPEDRISGIVEKCAKSLLKFTYNLHLTDIWRYINKIITENTYINPLYNKSNSRIDYIFINEQFKPYVQHASI